MKKKQGFTLVELMIVMILIGILMLAGWVGYGQMRQNALKSTYCNNIRTIETAMQAYMADNAIYSFKDAAHLTSIANAVLADDSNYVSDTVKKNVYTGDKLTVTTSDYVDSKNRPDDFDPTLPQGTFKPAAYQDSNGFFTQFVLVTNPDCTKTGTATQTGAATP